ncbi:MAG: anion permease, partial [Firmicutes bacterium]|nr:anion permease [Bacillota bacterium]
MDSLYRKRDGLQTLIRTFIKKEPVLVIAALAAAVSCFFVSPDGTYFSYLDLRTLALLYCLMTVVAGLRQAGLFEHLAQEVCERSGSLRMLSILLVLLCFFTSMLITNDVALLTFVPFAVIVLGMSGRLQHLIRVVVLQTVAANLGSMLTPVGNPQNLYLYSYYGLGMGEFLGIT